MDDDLPPEVLVEVVLLRLEPRTGATGLAYRTVRVPIGASTPDEVARRACTPAGGGQPVDVLHSTSWRHEPGAGVVLTYAALPDPDPGAPAVPLVRPSVVSSGDPLRPQPEFLHPHHVVAHAVRHLVELAGRDPGVRTAAAVPARRATWAVMTDEAHRMPTGTHAQTHAAAGAASVAPTRTA